LSRVVPDGLAMLPPALRQRLQVTQQCRPEDIDAVRERYRSHDIPAELGTYFEDMAGRLADAHVFIGRAGASTIAELTAVGRPAILVPLAIATDDHQAANTREMVRSGGARMIRETDFTAKELAKQVQALGQRPDTLANAAHAAWNCGRPRAVEDLADLLESFGGAEMMDVIRVGANNARGATQGIPAGQGAAKERAS
jgi:UDP-N-acetylglucosamine--N-acetylmuramyl-(pentapeptide) pyrophosphoryl-undecaprenol N-acetylglucosamine transferase